MRLHTRRYSGRGACSLDVPSQHCVVCEHLVQVVNYNLIWYLMASSNIAMSCELVGGFCLAWRSLESLEVRPWVLAVVTLHTPTVLVATRIYGIGLLCAAVIPQLVTWSSSSNRHLHCM